MTSLVHICRYISATDAAWAACIVPCAVGTFILYTKYLRQQVSQDGSCVSLQKPGLRQGIFLGFALSFTNVASGFGAAVSNSASLWGSVVSITVWGYILIWLGNFIGIGVMAKILGKYSSLAAGLLLIVIGIHQVL